MRGDWRDLSGDTLTKRRGRSMRAAPSHNRSSFFAPAEWAHQDSNLGPTDYESAALTD